jgi:hypothetical protein
MRTALQELAAEIVDMEEQFPIVELGYDPNRVDLRLAELEQEVAVLRAALEPNGSGEDVSARAREIVLRAMNRALVSSYETVFEAAREIEAYRAEVLEELEAKRAETDGEIVRLRAQLQHWSNAPTGPGLQEHEARALAERIVARAKAEADIIRGSANHVATEQLARVRAEWQRRLDAHREALEAARVDYERQRDGYVELRRRLSERLGAAGAAELLADLEEPSAPVPALPIPDEDAFRRFFDEDVEEEPSRAWILGVD